MRDLVDTVERWAAAGRRAALARVVGREGRASPPWGTALAVDETGEVAGSLDVPGGEAAALLAGAALLDGRGSPAVVAAGGFDILLAPADWSVLVPLAGALRAGLDVALAAVVRGPSTGAVMLVGGHGRLAGSLGDDRLDAAAGPDALGALALRRTTTHRYGRHGERRGDDVAVYVESFNRPPRLLVLGASGLTAALVRVGSAAGFRVIVADARPAFATAARYPAAHTVVCAPLDEHLRAQVQIGARDAACVVTGDPGEEVAALVAALGTRAGFVGALAPAPAAGGRRRALRAAGVSEDALARVFEPPDAAAGPHEVALAACAEIAARRGGPGPPPPPPSFR